MPFHTIRVHVTLFGAVFPFVLSGRGYLVWGSFVAPGGRRSFPGCSCGRGCPCLVPFGSCDLMSCGTCGHTPHHRAQKCRRFFGVRWQVGWSGVCFVGAGRWGESAAVHTCWLRHGVTHPRGWLLTLLSPLVLLNPTKLLCLLASILICVRGCSPLGFRVSRGRAPKPSQNLSLLRLKGSWP